MHSINSPCFFRNKNSTLNTPTNLISKVSSPNHSWNIKQTQNNKNFIPSTKIQIKQSSFIGFANKSSTNNHLKECNIQNTNHRRAITSNNSFFKQLNDNKAKTFHNKIFNHRTSMQLSSKAQQSKQIVKNKKSLNNLMKNATIQSDMRQDEIKNLNYKTERNIELLNDNQRRQSKSFKLNTTIDQLNEENQFQLKDKIEKLQLENLRLKEKMSELRSDYQNLIQNLTQQNQENIKELIKIKVEKRQNKTTKGTPNRVRKQENIYQPKNSSVLVNTLKKIEQVRQLLQRQTTNYFIIKQINKIIEELKTQKYQSQAVSNSTSKIETEKTFFQEKINQLLKKYQIKEMQVNKITESYKKIQLQYKNLIHIHQNDLFILDSFRKNQQQSNYKINKLKQQLKTARKTIQQPQQQTPKNLGYHLPTLKQQLDLILQQSQLQLSRSQVSQSEKQYDPNTKTENKQNIQQYYNEILQIFNIQKNQQNAHNVLRKQIMILKQYLSALLNRCKCTEEELKTLIEENVYLKEQNENTKRNIEYIEETSRNRERQKSKCQKTQNYGYSI